MVDLCGIPYQLVWQQAVHIGNLRLKFRLADGLKRIHSGVGRQPYTS